MNIEVRYYSKSCNTKKIENVIAKWGIRKVNPSSQYKTKWVGSDHSLLESPEDFPPTFLPFCVRVPHDLVT